MSQASSPESVLLVDCGAVATKVGLVDRVGEDYRLIGVTRAPTTVEPPTLDVTIGVRRAIAELEILTGRHCLSHAGELLTPEKANGEGVDALVAITSAATPLRAAVIGLSRDFSVASAQRALTSTYTVLEHSIAVDEESGRWGTTARDGRAGGASGAVENLAALHPDVIVMVGGVDGGALAPLLEMASIVASVGAAAAEGKRPLVLFAGNREARAQVAERIGSLMQFRAVDNVRPLLDVENLAPLQTELEEIFREHKLKQIPGMDKLNAWSAQPVVTAVSAYEKVAQFLARRYGLRVRALDLGGATTTVINAEPNRVTRALAADAGLGYGLDQLIARVGLERVARWLPSSLALEDAHASWLNQALRPWTTPTLPQEMMALHAAAHETLGAVAFSNAERAQPVDLYLLTGAPIAHGSKASALMLLALDVLESRGIFSIAADTTGLAPALGALAAVNAEAAAQVVERDGFVTVGTALVPTLVARPGETAALQAVVESAAMGRLELQVAAGSLELIPLGLGEKANVEIRAARGVDFGVPTKNGVLKREMEGGIVGLVIDARGRPLPFAENLEQQRERAQQWLWDVGA